MNWGYNKKKKRKKLTRKSVIKGVNGAISIMLCLLLTPFLSIALGLVEYARYQQVIEISDEIYELTGFSMMSNYDSYIHNRFGLLCAPQDGTFGEGADDLLSENLKLLGNQISFDGGTAVRGILPLSNSKILEQQVIDFSELTGTTAVLAEDFDLEELLEKLQGVEEFQEITSTVRDMSELTDLINSAVTALEELETAINDVTTAVEDAATKAETLANNTAELYEKLGNEGITLPSTATLSSESTTTIIDQFCADYLDDFKKLYTDANNLVSSIGTAKEKLTNLSNKADAFIDAVELAANKAESLSTSNSQDPDGSISEEAKSTLDDVLMNMQNLVEETVSGVKENVVGTANATLNQIINTALASAGLTNVVTRYQEIVNGEYFKTPLSDLAKQDLFDLLRVVYDTYTANNGENLSQNLLNYFKEKFVGGINDIDVSNLLDQVQGIIEASSATVSKDVNDSLVKLLTNLVNIVKGLFDLEVFYDPDLNAYVNIDNAGNNPYQKFLNAIGDLFSAVDTFKESAESGGLAKIKKALEAMKDMFTAIGDLLDSLVEIATETITSIASLGADLLSGNLQGLYEKLLIASYLEHNLPCRLDDGNLVPGDPGTLSYKITLEGSGLTGFSYDDIARPNEYIGQAPSGGDDDNANKTMLEGIGTLVNNLKAGHGNDKMFKGAELEYIRAGTNSELVNQVIVFLDMYCLRLLLDIPSVLGDGEVGVVAGSATVAAWIVYILYIIAEPFCDTVLLVNGAEVPLIRTKCWLTASGLAEFLTKLGDEVLGDELKDAILEYTGGSEDDSESTDPPPDGKKNLGAVDYRTHLLILLLIYVPPEDMIHRLAGLIELETKEYYRQQGLGDFDLDRSYTTVELTARVTFNPFFDFNAFTGGTSILPSVNMKQTLAY